MRANERRVIRRCIRRERIDLAMRLERQLFELDRMKPAELTRLARDLAAKHEGRGRK